MEQTARILVLLGGVFILAGGVVYLLSRLNINFNRMPGNFVYSGENMTVYIPCAASILDFHPSHCHPQYRHQDDEQIIRILHHSSNENIRF